MRTIVRLAALAAAGLLIGSCVSLEEKPMTPGAIQKDQRLITVVFGPPGPVITEIDNKGETAAKIVPGLGLIVKDAQDQRNLKASQDLQQYLPGWQAAQSFAPLFLDKLKTLGQPGAIVEPKDAGLPPDAWPKFNRASDVLDWQLRYFVKQPEGMVSRNYSTYLSLDDALVLEVNIGYGLESDGEENYTPTIKAVTKLVRVSNMRELWRHEDSVDDPAAIKTLYDFKLQPGELVYAWQRMLPALVDKILDSLGKNLQAAGVPVSGMAVSASSGAATSSVLPPGSSADPYGVPREAVSTTTPVPSAVVPAQVTPLTPP